MKKTFSILFMTLAYFGTAKALKVQTVTMKDGSVFKGYIERIPIPGRTIEFHSEEALVRNATLESESPYTWEQLPADWKQFLQPNQECTETLQAQSWLMGTARLKGQSHSNVLLLESGVVVTYQEITPYTYTLNWKDIQSINVARREPTALSGINRNYVLTTGTMEGQYAGESDSTLSIYDRNGMKNTFSKKNMRSCTYTVVNAKQPLFEQAELLDVVCKKGGSEVEGVIIEQNYNQPYAKDNYFMVEKSGGQKEKVLITDITTIRRKENSAYKPLFDVLLKNGEMVINRQKTKEQIGVKHVLDRLMLDSIGTPVEIKAPTEGKVTVEYYDANASNAQIYQLVKVKENENIGNRRNKQLVSYFTYEDLAKHIKYQPSPIETSVNKTAKVVFTVNEPGLYALYDVMNEQARLFRVSK